MTLEYNGSTYVTTQDSIYRDISIVVDSLDNACTLVKTFDGMSEYTFANTAYSGMLVTKRNISIGNDIVVSVKLRKKSEKESMQEEIKSLRSAMEELALTTNKTTTAKIKKILERG